MIKVAHFGATG